MNAAAIILRADSELLSEVTESSPRDDAVLFRELRDAAAELDAVELPSLARAVRIAIVRLYQKETSTLTLAEAMRS